MKKITLIAFTICLAGMLHAQSEKFINAMQKNLESLWKGTTEEDYQNAANSFERIATAEKEQWQPYYYAAYALVMKSFMTKDRGTIDANCDKANELLGMAESLSPKNAEILTLQSMVYSARMQVDPASRGMTMGPKSGMLLEEAYKIQPGNPRTLMQLAQSKYYTPAAFGGGKDQAMALIKKSVAAYDTFKPATEVDPAWGKEYAKSLQEQWSK